MFDRNVGLPFFSDRYRDMSSPLRYATLGVLIGLADIGVREVGGNNVGPQIATILKSCDPPIKTPAPWCAALIQFASDAAARALGVKNPLDAVKLEAYVQSYVEWAKTNHRVIPPSSAIPGDLVCFSFGGSRYDHIGMVQSEVSPKGIFTTVEGNTSDASQRDGDAVARSKVRDLTVGKFTPLFIRWSE
jgi:hypothetical protein